MQNLPGTAFKCSQARWRQICRIGLIATLFSTVAFADSSWRWISETRPYDVLPFVAVGTILIETLAISIVPKIKKTAKVFCVITLANLISFAAPYILCFFDPIYTFAQMLDHCPIFTVGLAYLIITIAVELPIVFKLLKKDTENKKTLLWTIIVSNIITTVLVAIVERMFCQGHW